MAFDIATIIINILGTIVFLSVALSLMRGAPPVPSNKRVISAILEIAKEYSSTNAVDLGAEDGRIIYALALQGIPARGYEINPLLVWWGNMRLRKANLRNIARMHTANLWQQNLAEFDLVIIYGLPSVMHHFEAKLQKELQPGAHVISNSFPLPTWKPIKKMENVYLYEKPAK